jgi:2-phospho-L-lactate transferase/gluconeogenesis factor (CofD/UPF0052 family)
LRYRVGGITEVVTGADDGGSSGRLRQELGVASPGDVRNCLVALAGRRKLAEVFNYRFEGEGDLSEHSVGNITIPTLLGAGVREALAGFAGPVLYVANAMTQPGETTGFTVSDHLRALAKHIGLVVTDVLVHSGELPRELVARYAAEGAAQCKLDREEIGRLGVRLREADLFLDQVGPIVRHNADRLAKEVCKTVLVRI